MDADDNRGTNPRQEKSDIMAEVLAETLRLVGHFNNLAAVITIYLGTKEGAELLSRGQALLLALRKGAFLPESGVFNLPSLALMLGVGVEATRDQANKAGADNYSLGHDRMHKADDLIRKGIESGKPSPKKPKRS